MDLQRVRLEAGLSQVQLAERMGIKQTDVSRLERQSEWKWTTIVGYLHACGVNVLVARMGEKDLEIPVQ